MGCNGHAKFLWGGGGQRKKGIGWGPPMVALVARAPLGEAWPEPSAGGRKPQTRGTHVRVGKSHSKVTGCPYPPHGVVPKKKGRKTRCWKFAT